MALPSEFKLGELWYVNRSTTKTASFVTSVPTQIAASTKLRAFDVDLAGLKSEIAEDQSLRDSFQSDPPPTVVRRTGSFSFKMYLEGGSDSTSPLTVATLLGAVMGGIRSPTAISDAAEAASTTILINAAAHGMEENELVLVGTKGDTRGDGQVVPIADASNADHYDLALALPVAPAALDVLKNGHSIFIDWTVESYQDFVFVGSHFGTGATDDPDQIQMIRCSATASFGGFEEGAPWVQFNYQVGDWQFVAYANRALTPAYATSSSGKDPTNDMTGGSFILQDNGTTTRNAIPAVIDSIDLGMKLQKIVDHNYSNSIGGWKKVPADRGAGPRIAFTAYWAQIADMPGLYSDGNAGTAKQVLAQFGTVAQNVAAFYVQRGHIRPIDPSSRAPVDELTGLKLVCAASKGIATDFSSAAEKLQDAAIVVWLG